MSNVSSLLYLFPTHFLLGDLVNANPDNFQTHYIEKQLGHLLWNYSQVNALETD